MRGIESGGIDQFGNNEGDARASRAEMNNSSAPFHELLRQVIIRSQDSLATGTNKHNEN